MNNSTKILHWNQTNINSCHQCHFDLSKAELPIVLLLTLVLNAAAVYILIKIRPKCVSVDHTCVIVLAINDFVTALLYSVMWIGGWIKCGCLMGRNLCNVLGWFATSMMIWSAWVVIILAGCRYLATIKPLYYRAHVSSSSIHVFMVATLCLTLLQLIDPTPRMRRAKLEGDEAALPIDGPWQPGSHPVPGLPIRPATVQCQSGGGRVFPPVVVLRQKLERNDCLQWLYQGLPPESLRDGHLRNLINRTNFSADKSAFFSCFVFYSLQWSFWQWRCHLAILSADVPMHCLCTIYLVRELAIKICIPPICSLILPQFQR